MLNQKKNKEYLKHNELQILNDLLKSVNSNFTLAIHSPKLGQAKTHFLSHFWEKNMARPGFEPTISRSEVNRANHYSIGPLLES